MREAGAKSSTVACGDQQHRAMASLEREEFKSKTDRNVRCGVQGILTVTRRHLCRGSNLCKLFNLALTINP